MDNAEMDSVAMRGNKKIYIQVCGSFNTQAKIDVEFGNLLTLKDVSLRTAEAALATCLAKMQASPVTL